MAGDKKIGFSVSVEKSIADAERVLENAREGYEISVRAREKATLGVADEAIWSVTNDTLLVRQKNAIFQIMWPNDKRGQAEVAKKIVAGL